MHPIPCACIPCACIPACPRQAVHAAACRKPRGRLPGWMVRRPHGSQDRTEQHLSSTSSPSDAAHRRMCARACRCLRRCCAQACCTSTCTPYSTPAASCGRSWACRPLRGALPPRRSSPLLPGPVGSPRGPARPCVGAMKPRMDAWEQIGCHACSGFLGALAGLCTSHASLHDPPCALMKAEAHVWPVVITQQHAAASCAHCPMCFTTTCTHVAHTQHDPGGICVAICHGKCWLACSANHRCCAMEESLSPTRPCYFFDVACGRVRQTRYMHFSDKTAGSPHALLTHPTPA